ncbi:hypothetical protein Val02_71360 [Virgisporangium aliadipatigenens]|uniref:Uncharacterized protein n=1 Tax=Virgisporangium aliadipatigenens TaxID=741659 RepID=A0A8J3YUU6_9ACTN|nr:hypothetical protein [Virgisporangium aliadipatigenens]GIJ50250.1 hypothetical protein Val02_71360 [Virgisporangium aliadipatigenens]
MTIRRKLALLIGGIAALSAVLVGPASAAPDNPGPQGVKMNKDDAARDECLYLRQLNPAEQKYRTVNNNYFTYEVGTYGTEWFDVACGALSFTVPYGETALVDLTAVAELDCQSGAANSWCGGRFLINGQPLPWPVNTGRSDSYAWDSANGGKYDWQANTLAQEYVVICREPDQQRVCTYKVQLQSRLENGAESVWIDDLTVRVDVTVGKVDVASLPTTP